MYIINKSKNRVLTKNCKEVVSVLDQMFGLLLSSNPRYMLFRTSFGIHTFFMKKPIDVIVLDNEYKVVKICENLKPNRVFFWNPKYNLVLELPSGTVKKTETKISDKLNLLF